jgi:hypothetical protein
MLVGPSVFPVLSCRLPDVYMKALDLPELVGQARAAVDAHIAAAVHSGGSTGAQPHHLVLDLPCTLFAVRSLR